MLNIEINPEIKKNLKKTKKTGLFEEACNKLRNISYIVFINIFSLFWT